MSRRVFHPDDPEVRAYRLLTALVVPRPIAWVSSRSADGIGNLAPHSFFTVASARPPVVQFTSVGDKDTLANVRAIGEFVINLASRPQMEVVNATSARFGRDVDEAIAVGVATEPSDRVGVPRVADAPASIECTLHSTVEVGDSTLVLGTVVALTVREEVLDGAHPLMSRLAPVSRLGRDEWGLPPEVVHLERPGRPPAT